MIRIEVEVETNDPTLRDYVLGDIESWRRTPATVSVSTREEDAWTGGSTVHVSSSMSLGGQAVAERTPEDDQPPPARRVGPPKLTTVEAARDSAAFPVYVMPALSSASTPHVVVEPGGDTVPPSVVVTHMVDDERGHHRGNVWVTSSPALLPISRFEAWRTVDRYDVYEDRSGGYYRCKVRAQLAEAGFVQLESTGHRLLDEVLDLMETLSSA